MAAGRPAVDRETISVILDEDLSARLSIFRSRNPEIRDPDEAVRHILRLWLTENGYDGLHEDEGTRPDELNASNDG